MDRAEEVHSDAVEADARGGARPGKLGPIVTAHHTVTLFPAMGAALDAIARDVDEARARAWVETFIYRDDRLGEAFGERLASAAARGVDVRLLYDPLGSQETAPAFFEGLRARGVQVRPYRPPRVVLRRGGYFPRDHARVIAIDDRGYTGGAAWGEEWLPKERGGEGWHDVCSRVEGPCSGDFARAFARRWGEALGRLDPEGDYATGGRYPDLELVADTPTGRRQVYQRYRRAVRGARRRVWVENAYCLPPLGLLDDLYAAAARGCDVRVIAPRRTDLPILRSAARAEYGQWISRGVRVFEYLPAMMHGKFALVDDRWGTVGTFNANVTALRWTNEANLFVSEPAVVAALAEIFEADQGDCEALTLEALALRPWHVWLRDALANGAFAILEVGSGSRGPVP